MKKVVNKVEYNTETATLVMQYVQGFFGDPAGYEECLYKTEKGKYFLYVNGGETSPYAKEDIIVLTAPKAKAWQEAKNN